MPDENTNPVWTAQTSQNNQTATSQPWDDFILDFGDLWDDNAPAAEEVQVESSLAEEEKVDDELGFDIDLTKNDEDMVKNDEEWADNENKDVEDASMSVENPEWEESVNDFDISMDYEWSTEDTEPEDKEVVSEEDTEPEDKEVVSEEDTESEDKEVVSEDIQLRFMDNIADSWEESNQSNEGHLFQQVNDDNQNEMNFDMNNQSNEGEAMMFNEMEMNKQFLTTDTVKDNTIWEENSGSMFNHSEESNSMEWIATLDIEPEEQKQPEISDLLWNSPIDLSKELNDISDNQEPNFWNNESLAQWNALEDENNSIVSEEDTKSEGLAPEAISQELNSESNIQVENNEFLLDSPQMEPEDKKVEQNVQAEFVENKASHEETQGVERSEMVNNSVIKMNEQNNSTPEVNTAASLELSNTNNVQKEAVESNNQVQSTLSLDQILDSELLSTQQYSEDSKASPQNIPSSWWGKSKMWLLIGVWVAALACCAAFLAFPSISWNRKPGDTIDTWTAVEHPEWGEEQHSSASNNPSEWQESNINPDTPENLNIPWGQWSMQEITFPEEWAESWDVSGNTEPVPYVWGDYWDPDEPEIQEPIIEEIDQNQILDSILSFKSQAEKYYSYGQESSDKQLMKYALRLINLCDNYSTKINNGEEIDAESYSSFRSSANKLISKITTYMGWEDEVQIIEATIGSEYNFEWKDEIIEYLQNNR